MDAYFESGELRYAQCSEDADVMLAGLEIGRGDVCLSVASAGDNVLSMLVADPGKVVAVDVSAAQLACLELKVAALRVLSHEEVLALMGARGAGAAKERGRRWGLYERCRGAMGEGARGFWDRRRGLVEGGIFEAGMYERGMARVRRWVLPLMAPRWKWERLALGGEGRAAFYDGKVDTWRWRMGFRLFFSRAILRLGHRGPAFYSGETGEIWREMLERARHGVAELDPAENGCLQWGVLGRYGKALPHWLRAENFEVIRARVGRLEWRLGSMLEVMRMEAGSGGRVYLSNILEYLPEWESLAILREGGRVGAAGGRLMYWDMMRARSGAGEVAGLRRIEGLGLMERSTTFFYRVVMVEVFEGSSGGYFLEKGGKEARRLVPEEGLQ